MPPRTTPTKSASQPRPEPAPPSVLEELRQWRLRASLRFVGKSMRSSSTSLRKATK